MHMLMYRAAGQYLSPHIDRLQFCIAGVSRDA